ncbi:hypothetical protein J6590_062493 [Homalodisca vitripennis]|nr:hypothetical protein J6590_062493 [Homalodisca vitripennis]
MPVLYEEARHPDSAPVKCQFCMRKQGILIVPLSNASCGGLCVVCWGGSDCPCQKPVLYEGARHLNSAPVLMPVMCKGARHPDSAPVKGQFYEREQGILIVPLSNASSL